MLPFLLCCEWTRGKREREQERDRVRWRKKNQCRSINIDKMSTVFKLFHGWVKWQASINVARLRNKNGYIDYVFFGCGEKEMENENENGMKSIKWTKLWKSFILCEQATDLLGNSNTWQGRHVSCQKVLDVLCHFHIIKFKKGIIMNVEGKKETSMQNVINVKILRVILQHNIQTHTHTHMACVTTESKIIENGFNILSHWS